jgi:DNA polymerase-3 subunit alpha
MVKPTSVSHVDRPPFSEVKLWFDTYLHAEKVDLDDQRVYENVYHDGRWAAVFQFTERGAQNFARRAKPRSITDIAAITSIYRPGPLTANVDKLFVEAKEKLERGEQLEFDHPIVERVLGETYGYMIFQESFMLLGKELGNLTWEDCDKLRKVLVKKSIGQDVNDKKAKEGEAIRVKFVSGAVANGMAAEKANEIWDQMALFSGYGFNKTLAPFEKLNIYKKDGKFVDQRSISNVEKGQYLKSRDEKTGETIYVEVKALHDHGELELIEYTFDDGSKVTCTPNHKFRTSCGQMIPIEQIVRQGLCVVSIAENHTITGPLD